MELLLKKPAEVVRPLLFLSALFITVWFIQHQFAKTATHLTLSSISLETVEQIVKQVQEENAETANKRGGKKDKPDIKEEIELAKERISKSQYRAAKSNYKRMVQHVEKLEKYRQNPMKYDNMGLLKKAPTEEIRQKIIQSRIAHLEKEIHTFYNNIVKIIH